ncbi:MAG TPA: primosomal protein N' [Candidatus Saccharimonadales bacterium]|nr:primosomal protein N' [Candidatus Saccharimonadales bacterium]
MSAEPSDFRGAILSEAKDPRTDEISRADPSSSISDRLFSLEVPEPPPETQTVYCDVALPVPLDAIFTYEAGDLDPIVGGRVVVPFGRGAEKRLSGIVTRVHNEPPETRKLKRILQVLDTLPVLDDSLLALGKWIAQYYLAPIGEVYRTMLPLQAEFRQAFGYRITELGEEALFDSANAGSSRRSQRDPEHQMSEYAVLDALSEGELVREERLRSATGASREVLRGLQQKKWIVREDLSGVRDARRIIKLAVLCEATAEAKERKLNAAQQRIIEMLRDSQGRMRMEDLREAGTSPSSLKTLVRHELVEIVEAPAEHSVPHMKPRTTLESSFTVRQKDALATIRANVDQRQFHVALLHGVTGSGKTAVYLAAMQSVLAAGRGSILLVPEIGLTPGVAADLYSIFGEEIAILHSSLSDAERAEQWHRIRRGEARIAVGTRSAIFAPMRDLALIIVDEEHDNSYKQEETPRYHGRDVAVMRAKALGATVVLGSATPSLESFQNATRGKYALIELPDRVQERPLPEVELIDMREEFQQTGKESVLSRKLIEETTARLERGEQAMILLNRRGYSAWVMCRSCGDTVQCRDCAVAMTYHKRQHRLLCHYCGYQAPVPKTCPKCGSDYVQFLGTGSEKLEDMLHAAFPKARIGRMDRDTVRGHDDFERMLSEFQAGDIDLLVGTQMIAKGHDVHGVTLVGVVGADTALGLPDFRAAERTFQLLTQVAGRAGRGEVPGKVVLQTHFPDHYAVQFAAHHDYQGFAEKELRFRGWMHYPPFDSLANVVLRSDKQEEALRYSGVLGNWFQSVRHEGVRIMGPAPAPITRLKKDYRFHFVLKAGSRERLNSVLRAMLATAQHHKIPRTSIIVDVDAMSLS